jgi:hypothetical protein
MYTALFSTIHFYKSTYTKNTLVKVMTTLNDFSVLHTVKEIMKIHRPEVALTSSEDMLVWEGRNGDGGSSRIHPLATCRQLRVFFITYANERSDSTHAHVKDGTQTISQRLLNLESTSHRGQGQTSDFVFDTVQL